MSALDAVRLERLAGEIEDGLKRHEPAFTITRHLVKHEGASIRQANNTEILRLAGVTAGCTMGQYPLLMNWCNAARRKIAEVSS